MEVDRRTLMKGMLASGALLALGLPSWTFANQSPRRPRQCALILSGISADTAFARGGQSACASMAYEGFRPLQLKGGLLTGTDEMDALLAHCSGSRIIAILDDASAVIFLELARAAGVRMLSMGSHGGSTGTACHIRHDFASSSHDSSVGGLLASQLLQNEDAFVITEHFLGPQQEVSPISAWAANGFVSYRSAGATVVHLHASGLSAQDACCLLDLEATGEWTRIPREACSCEAVTWRGNNWVESLGYAVTASALGTDSVKESCSCRAFVRRTAENKPIGPQESFMSFVMDL